MNKLILRGILIIAAITTIAVGSTSAYFTDTKVVIGTKFTAGNWDTSKAIMVINEVYYLGDEEWIELYNAGDATADIKGWSICDNTNNCGTLNPAQKTEVTPGAFVLVSHNKIDKKDWELSKDATEINYAGGKIEFDDIGDAVKLKNTENTVIDQMSYGTNTTAFTPSCPTVTIGYSLQRIPAGKDTDKQSDFQPQPNPTPGSL